MRVNPTIENIAVENCLNGTWTPNVKKDLPDIFWLMGWADWEIERQFLTDDEQQ